jgi:hypothetical protein
MTPVPRLETLFWPNFTHLSLNEECVSPQFALALSFSGIWKVEPKDWFFPDRRIFSFFGSTGV